MTIWKYPIKADGSVVKAPQGARFLTAQLQRGQLCVWAAVDPSAPIVEYRIAVYSTGESITEPGQYLGTFQVEGGMFVFHVFLEP